mgnify:CR=1 FL=1
MKSFSFSQLQTQILLLIIILFTSMTLSYRYFIEQPHAERALKVFQNKELQLIQLSIKESIKHLQAITYDYAVWDDTYNFVNAPYDAYTTTNFVNDTFVSLAIDGVLIINKNGETVYSQGFLHRVQQQFTLFSEGVKQLPAIINRLDSNNSSAAPRKSFNIVLTPAGLTLYSAVEIRRSDKSGEFSGFFVFFRQLNQKYFDGIAETVMTPIKFELLADKDTGSTESYSWLSELEKTKASKYSFLRLEDVLGHATAQLRIEHQQYKVPPLLDMKAIGFISFFSLIMFVAFLMFNNRIIRPVQRFLRQVKALDTIDGDTTLSEDFRITELNTVAKHINHLHQIVNEQNTLLSEQLTIDSLTGLSNRRGLEEHLAKHCDLMTRQGVPFAIVLIEIDYFEQYRSVLGLVDGDQLLIQIADILRFHIKRKNDICAHFKKEEFVSLYSGIDQAQLAQILNDIVSHVDKLKIPHPNSNISSHVTLSIGACYIGSSQGAYDFISVKNVMRAADFALYQSREKGRNCHTSLSFETFTEIVKVPHE